MLCHLVNMIRPRSVISIHVPQVTQAGVVKLTPAKSRRNVENFLDACRRLGVSDVSPGPLCAVMALVLDHHPQGLGPLVTSSIAALGNAPSLTACAVGACRVPAVPSERALGMILPHFPNSLCEIQV